MLWGQTSINHVVEQTAPIIESITNAKVGLRILSNLCDARKARAQTRIPVQALGGREVADRIVEADRFARIDPYRAATHNKGFMNGVGAVALATGNDWRAIEAGAHAYACRDGVYRGLTRWQIDGDFLHGQTELPMAVGTVGGITRSHPTIAILRRLLGIESAQTLAALFACVGLAQNLGAIKALATEGIQRGHMSLHARQLAIAAGAKADEVATVVQHVTKNPPVTAGAVELALKSLRESNAQK